jgi:sensor histidine kinase YesM
MNPTNQFQYAYENLSLYVFAWDWLMFLVILVIGILIMVGSYYAIFQSELQIKSRKIKQALEKKKRILWDLIVMKDIQTELEKEIEQAILKAAFHA